MMKEELQGLLNEPLEDWKWKMAEFVYMNHPTIEDVRGKQQVADIVKQGFGWDSPIRAMYKEINGPVIIAKTMHQLFTTYDVTHESLCINERGNPMDEIYAHVKKELQEKYPDLWGKLDYFDQDVELRHRSELWDTDTHWIAVFYVRGGSEGYYIHVETRKDGQAKIIFLGKTLLEGEEGVQCAEQTANAIARIMKV
jgi:hypothetical protein